MPDKMPARLTVEEEQIQILYSMTETKPTPIIYARPK
jgi:hypothetical protein